MAGDPATLPKSDEATFVSGVSAQTGIDPRVLIAWIKQEGAYAPGGTGNYNYFNLRPYPGDPYSGVSAGNFEQFSNVQSAITATVRRLKQPFAAPIIQAAQAHDSPAQEIAAIASTGWDAAHYGGPGGPNLLSTFEGLYGASAAGSAYAAPSTPDYSGGGAGGAISSAAGSVVSGAQGAVSGVEKGFDFFTSWRFWEIVGGFLLLIVGLILVGRSFGVGGLPRTPFDRYADRMPTSREGTPRRTTSYVPEDMRRAPKPAASYDYGEVPF